MSYEREDKREVRRQRGDRSGRDNAPVNGGEPRKSLVWEPETILTQGQVVCSVQSAALDRGGRRFSFRIGKESRDNPDRPFPHMDVRDIQNLKEVIAQLELWVDTKRAVSDDSRNAGVPT